MVRLIISTKIISYSFFASLRHTDNRIDNHAILFHSIVCNENRTDHFIESMYTFLDHVNNLENFDKNKMTMNQFCRPKEYWLVSFIL